MTTTFIYALCEPGTRTVRYIGKTSNPQDRLRRHLRDSKRLKTHLGCWMKSLLSPPDMIVFREVTGNGSEAEMRYIRLARGCGMMLVNATDGGDGVTMTPEIREKIGAAGRGRQVSEETRAKQSAGHQGPKYSGINHSQFGVPRSEESKAKMRAAVRPKASEETKAKMSESARLAWAARKQKGGLF